MKEQNKIYLMNCMEALKKLEDNSIDLIITSPPYNKGGEKGERANTKGSMWHSSIHYNTYDDNMPEEEYQEWQVEFLNECFRVLKPTGSLFYNHKVRVHNNIGIHPMIWISKTKLLLRQVITWDRIGSVNVNGCSYIPTTEQFYWLTKSNKNVRFSRQTTATEVWRMPHDMNNSHPAPFPIGLPDLIIKDVLGDKKMRATLGNITVLDPFMGSGTTAMAAIKNGCNWIGFDIDKKYKEMAYNRIKAAYSNYKFGDTAEEISALKGEVREEREEAAIEVENKEAETVAAVETSIMVEKKDNAVVKIESTTVTEPTLTNEKNTVTPKAKNKRRYKMPTAIYDLNGKFVKSAASYTELAKEMGKSHNNIHFKDTHFTRAYNYYWLEVDNGNFPKCINPKTGEPVVEIKFEEPTPTIHEVA